MLASSLWQQQKLVIITNLRGARYLKKTTAFFSIQLLVLITVLKMVELETERGALQIHASAGKL